MTRGTILVFPGGGYRRHAEHEAEPVAEWLESLGWRARVVRYPVDTRHPGPLDAVRQEIAAERAAGSSTVGVIGFSAGGHLAGHAAVAPDSSAAERPDFAILGYPVVSMTRRPHVGSRAVLLGTSDAAAGTTTDTTTEDDDALARSLSLETLVRADTPPMFVWHTVGDRSVPVQHTYLLGAALADAGVDHEVHTFPGDVHGVGLGTDPVKGTEAAAWTTLAAAWLARR